uniref:Uncharacterized protein n=1 Tax=Timema shepardi TaxID=629360 RepID=A0A7R9B0D0_TIMSH|nr:unnamed protein product [Timema shepardi]
MYLDLNMTQSQPCDGPMGISVALSPATTTVTTVSKSMITNASFRTKKLPDWQQLNIVGQTLPSYTWVAYSHKEV